MLVCLLVCLTADSSRAQPGSVINRENTLKALFLYNFGSYVEWPAGVFASENEPFEIGVFGQTPVEPVLREIAANKKINGRRIVIRRFASIEALRPCPIVFISDDVDSTTQEIALQSLAGDHVLVVGESAGFAQRGGVVNFVVESNKLRFQINVGAARRRGLKISAKLLSLARIVGAASATAE